MERWDEEVLMLQEELRRTRRTFAFLSHAWAQTKTTHGCKPGYAEYANERSEMYASMADDCATGIEAAGGTDGDYMHPADDGTGEELDDNSSDDEDVDFEDEL
jgi:hypothetical protein